MDNSGVMRREIADAYLDVIALDVIARSESDEAIHSFFPTAGWIASLALAMTV
jgi:hypothetical protein